MATGLVLPLLLMSSGRVGGRRVSDDLLMAVAVMAVSAAFATLGFVLVTAPSAAWRRLRPVRVLIIGGGLGLVAPTTLVLITALIATAVLPLFHSARWLAVAILEGVPGIVLGLVAVLIARSWRT